MRLVGCPREDWHPQTEQGMPGALQQNTAALPPQNHTIGPAEHRVSDRPDDKVTQGWRASSLTISEVPSVSPARFRHIRPIHVLASPALEIPVVCAAVLFGLIIRLHRLGAEPLSSQEIYTWDFSHQHVSFILGRLSHIETNPPLYYLLMKLWMQVGETEFLLRLPSVVAGTLSIPLVYILGRLGGASKSGMLGAWLLALSAISVSYSRDARAYALLQDACLLAAIGTILIINHYTGSYAAAFRAGWRRFAGWILFTLASIIGFYLHYTFIFEILVLECAMAAAIAEARLSGNLRNDQTLVVAWFTSTVLLAVGIAWGLTLVQSMTNSVDIAWMQRLSLREAFRLFIHVDGFSAVSRFQPLPNLLLVGLAVIGFAAGWRRSSAVLVCGALFALFPVILFVYSQSRPIFIERSFVATSFAVCLLAAFGILYLARRLSDVITAALRRRGLAAVRLRLVFGIVTCAAIAALLGAAAISAANISRRHVVSEPYDEVARYLASVMKPGDTAAGTDGVIYYRHRTAPTFPYFKLSEGTTSQALVTYGAPTVRADALRALAQTGHVVYLVLRESINLVIGEHYYDSYANYVLNELGVREPSAAKFGTLGIYRLQGTCNLSAGCVQAAETRGSSVQ